jgi:hypothetical protein
METKMKKTILTILVFFMLILSACAGKSPATEGSESGQAAGLANQNPTTTAPMAIAAQDASPTVGLNTSYENAVSVELQLLLGTLKLEGELAVTKEQASVLLPLWNDLRTISLSMAPSQGAAGLGQGNTPPQPQDVSAEMQAQIDVLTKRILAAMTPEQIKAIAEMKITRDTAMTIMQEQGITMGGPQQGNGNGNPPPQGTPPAGGPGGDMDGPGAPPSGGQPPAGQMPAPSAGGGMVPPQLFDALLQLLERASGHQATATSAPTTAGSTVATSASGGTAAAYTQSGGTETRTNQTYTASATDESAVYVTNRGTFTLTNSMITTSGNTSSDDRSSFYGLNAAVLAESGSTINISNARITTSGTGANGAFATGSGSSVVLSNVTIEATGDGGHGVMATNGGSVMLTDVNMTTAGIHSGAIATDRGGGTIIATGSVVTTSGQDSPGIYSTGNITVTNAKILATGAESAVIEGANSITLMDTDLSSSKADKWGMMIYQSMSGDAQGSRGVFTMTGGSLAYTAADGPLFYVTNSTGVITLKGAKVTAASGILVDASANSRWGQSGSNGGHVILTADAQTLIGDMTADNISTIAATLQNGSALTGSINSAKTAKAVNLTLDASSTWTVTADSYLTCLTDPGGISGTTVTNVNGNGHTVYYDGSACPALGSGTYILNGGGELKPAA